MPKRIVAGLIAAFAIVTAATAGQYDDAILAHQRGDYTTALSLMRPLAEEGLAAAQTSLGFAYSHGEGLPQDFAEAMKW